MTLGGAPGGESQSKNGRQEWGHPALLELTRFAGTRLPMRGCLSSGCRSSRRFSEAGCPLVATLSQASSSRILSYRVWCRSATTGGCGRTAIGIPSKSAAPQTCSAVSGARPVPCHGPPAPPRSPAGMSPASETAVNSTGCSQPAHAGCFARAAQASSCFISRTARSIPTMMARAMMLWPMFNSCISGMRATGTTF